MAGIEVIHNGDEPQNFEKATERLDPKDLKEAREDPDGQRGLAEIEKDPAEDHEAAAKKREEEIAKREQEAELNRIDEDVALASGMLAYKLSENTNMKPEDRERSARMASVILGPEDFQRVHNPEHRANDYAEGGSMDGRAIA